MSPFISPHGLYFEDYAVGDALASAGRTVTETDLVNFAGLSGDFSAIHTDTEVSRSGPFGQRVAHGLLVMSIASGLLIRLGFLEGTLQAFREMTWKFSLPVFIGDTLRAQATVVELKPTRRLGGGLVTFEIQILNHSDGLVQSGRWAVLVAGRPTVITH